MEPGHILSESGFLALGKKRCRLNPAERQAMYARFLRYQTVLEELSLWDDCDRIAALSTRLKAARESSHPSFDTFRRSMIYVDEGKEDRTFLELFSALHEVPTYSHS